MTIPIRANCFSLLLLCIVPLSAFAGARHFTFIYEATTSAREAWKWKTR
jgi:hypothetical protein